MKVRFLGPARSELRDAVERLNSEAPGTGDRLRDEVRAAIDRIKAFPDAWHHMGGGIRRCRVRGFRYGVIYEPSPDEIVIIAVAHFSREPGYWRTRRK
ncbi:MAG: type II toxin-antitoxin system RelE/ParE family toxin [Gammaproteobacteria bacterium]|nr:type II toxin-antitoxin system RelE/ParE family toxin [Gammaproteobacteria bacterium]NKC16977.1 type II toxin-antitoxin system RelE/ParE family toxin [Gammaproteobacteria bacterium]